MKHGHTTGHNDVAIVVRLPHDLRDALRDSARAEDRSTASLIRIALRAYLTDGEGHERQV